MAQGFPNLQEPVWLEVARGAHRCGTELVWAFRTAVVYNSHPVGVQSKFQISSGFVFQPAGRASMDISGSEELAEHLLGESDASRRIQNGFNQGTPEKIL